MKHTVSIVIPVYNEEKDLPTKIPVLHNFLEKSLKNYEWKIIIADNGPSKDNTKRVSKELVKKYKKVTYQLVPRPGRGNALREIWLKERADYLSYMDVDLSSGLASFPLLLSALDRGYDIAIGSRLRHGAKVHGRSLYREILSRGYNMLIKLFFWTKFQDAQCGFKAMTKNAAKTLLPHIKDNGWFFDSELLIIAEKSGFKIKEIPIIWRDDPASTVKVVKTAWDDIKGLARIFNDGPWEKIRNK